MSIRHLWVAYLTIVRKEWARFFRIWPQSFLPSVITMVLYFVIFGHIIGRRVGQMGGYDYMTFIMPGLVMMSLITNAYSNVVSSFFGVRYNRSVEELLVSPVPDWLIVAGYVTGGLSRGMIVGFLGLIIGTIFTGWHFYSIAMTLLVMLLASTLFALAGFINAVFARKFDDTSIVTTFILTPLIYFGGVFYSIDLLPHWGQVVSDFNPLRYVVSLFRFAMLDVQRATWGVALLVIIGSIVLLFGFACRCLAKEGRVRQ